MTNAAIVDEAERVAMRQAGLRSRLVSRATGLSVSRLQYWHKSGLIEATSRPGQRGVPRLYSWEDYLRLRLAASLDGIDTPNLRRAVDLLDSVWPDWYLVPAQTTARGGHVHVVHPDAWSGFHADAAGQFELPWDMDAELGELGPQIATAFEDFTGPGADLGLLRDFGDAVRMNPAINIAKPTMIGTALETAFIAGMASDLGGSDEFARVYRLDLPLVRRAVAFEEAVA